MNEKISVLVPIYNAEKYIKRCIDSIINQSYKNIEVILIEDGSTDNSYNIIKEYQEKGIAIDYEQIVKDIEQRDYQDTHRKVSPLCKAKDAVAIDTSTMSIEEVVDKIRFYLPKGVE